MINLNKCLHSHLYPAKCSYEMRNLGKWNEMHFISSLDFSFLFQCLPVTISLSAERYFILPQCNFSFLPAGYFIYPTRYFILSQCDFSFLSCGYFILSQCNFSFLACGYFIPFQCDFSILACKYFIYPSGTFHSLLVNISYIPVWLFIPCL